MSICASSVETLVLAAEVHATNCKFTELELNRCQLQPSTIKLYI